MHAYIHTCAALYNYIHTLCPPMGPIHGDLPLDGGHPNDPDLTEEQWKKR